MSELELSEASQPLLESSNIDVPTAIDFSNLRLKEKDIGRFIESLDNLLEKYGVPEPKRREEFIELKDKFFVKQLSGSALLKRANIEEIRNEAILLASYSMERTYGVSFHKLGAWVEAPPPKIDTVGSSILSVLSFRSTTCHYDILKDLSGYLYPGRFTLLLGPPGSGTLSICLDT